MTHAEFQILSPSSRAVEFNRSKDPDIIRYCISRNFNMPYDKVKSEIEIESNVIRHTLFIRSSAEIIIKILSILPQLKLNALSILNNELKFDLDGFFNKMM